MPLVVRLPAGIRKEVGVEDTPVGLVDVMPTLLDLAGLAGEPSVQGRSLAPALRGQELPERLVFFETASAVAVRSRNHKLIRFTEGREDFYDLSVDPREQQPRVGACEGPCSQLARRLEDFATAMAASRQSLQTEVVPLQEEDLEDMRALGYLD